MLDVNMIIANNIQAELKKENKKQVDLAEGIGVSKQTMSKIMNGARAINAIELHKISEYLHVSMDSLMTDVRPISVQGDYALEARGLWRIKGDFMGGPFVSHVRLDKANQRIIVSEIFIYSPDKMKRNLVRQMEASLYTLKLPGSKQEGAEIPVGVTSKDTTNNK